MMHLFFMIQHLLSYRLSTLHLGIYVMIHICIQQLMKKEMNLKESKEGCMRGLEEKNGKRVLCSFNLKVVL